MITTISFRYGLHNGRRMERGRKKRRENRKSSRMDRKIIDEETIYKGACGTTKGRT